MKARIWSFSPPIFREVNGSVVRNIRAVYYQMNIVDGI